MRRWTNGRCRRRGFKIGDSLLVAAEAGQSEAAIEPRLRMTREQRQGLVEGGKGVLRASQRQQHIAALIERTRIARLQRYGFVEAFEGLLVSLERVQHDPEVDPRIRSARVDLHSGADEPIGFPRLSALRFDGAEEIERVELIRRSLKHARVNLLGLAQPSLLLQRHGLAERPS